MFTNLKLFVKNTLPFTENELLLVDKYFDEKTVSKRNFLLQEGEICNFVAFLSVGSIRHFHTKDGVEKTCDISFENSWVTDFQSFNQNTKAIMNLQAMEDTMVFTISKENLVKLYSDCQKFETFGRLMTEQIAQRATEIAMSLSSDKPEERFLELLKNHPDLFQRVPQKYIANFLGISPESLSRIQKRIHEKKKS